MKRISAIIILTFILGLAAHVHAVSSSPTTDAIPAPATPVQMDADVNNLVFTGTVRKIANGTALVTKNATYLLSGGNFDGIVGQEVNIIGKIVKEGSIEKIQVDRAQLAQE